MSMTDILFTGTAAGTACCISPRPSGAVDARIGKLTFESGYLSKGTVQKLYDEMDFQRASQAYLWGIPAVGLNEWRKALLRPDRSVLRQVLGTA